jgi:hypothetical protein
MVVTRQERLDCFAMLAMTGQGDSLWPQTFMRMGASQAHGVMLTEAL